MKSSIAKLVPTYNTARMVREYASHFYAPSIKMTRKMTDGDLDSAKALTAWKDRVRAAWPTVIVKDIRLDSMDEVAVGEPLKVSAAVFLGGLTPDDVAVELYYGPTSGKHEIERGTIVRMKPMGRDGEGSWHFAGEIPTSSSGAHAFAARVVPYNEGMSNPYETSLVRWA